MRLLLSHRLLSHPLVSSGDHCPPSTLVKPLHSPCTRSFTSWNMFMLSLSLLITSPTRASWGFCLIRDAWGLCLHCADERSAVKRQTAWKQKDSFSCAHTLEQSQRQLFPSRVSQSLWLDLSLSIPSTLLVADLWKISIGKWKGPPKWYREEETCLNKPVLLFTLSLAFQVPPSSSDNWDSGAAELSKCHRGCTPVTSSRDWSGQMTLQRPQI